MIVIVIQLEMADFFVSNSENWQNKSATNKCRIIDNEFIITITVRCKADIIL